MFNGVSVFGDCPQNWSIFVFMIEETENQFTILAKLLFGILIGVCLAQFLLVQLWVVIFVQVFEFPRMY
jgi:hypothetical protein